MSPAELEAKRWQAAIDAVYGRNDLQITIMRRRDDTLIELDEPTVTEESIELMKELGAAYRVFLKCSTAEWAEMLAQGGK